MITIEDAKRAVQNAYTPQEWFLIVLKHDGWSSSPTRIGEFVRLSDDHTIQISMRGSGRDIGFAIANSGPTRQGKTYEWNTESVSVHSQPLVLQNVVKHLLRKSGCIADYDHSN